MLTNRPDESRYAYAFVVQATRERYPKSISWPYTLCSYYPWICSYIWVRIACFLCSTIDVIIFYEVSDPSKYTRCFRSMFPSQCFSATGLLCTTDVFLPILRITSPNLSTPLVLAPNLSLILNRHAFLLILSPNQPTQSQSPKTHLTTERLIGDPRTHICISYTPPIHSPTYSNLLLISNIQDAPEGRRPYVWVLGFSVIRSHVEIRL